jgi:pyridoxal phosphate enzyme (YggS family)
LNGDLWLVISHESFFEHHQNHYSLFTNSNSPYFLRMDLAENIQSVRKRIATVCERTGREPGSVTLLAVSKTHPPETVSEAAKLGLTLFGENKVQEAKAKIPLCPARLQWHMLGHLQTNKCRDAVELFEMIQSVDSFHLAEEINRRAEQASKRMPILLEVNAGGEASKFGYRPEQLVADLPRINQLPRVEVQGLMTIPPWGPNPERARPMFRQLRELKATCEEILGAPLPHLSMGMSGDFEVAIEEGATIVRIGTALFGHRNTRR